MGFPFHPVEALQTLPDDIFAEGLTYLKHIGVDRYTAFADGDIKAIKVVDVPILQELNRIVKLGTRSLARQSMTGYTRYMFKGYDENWHHRVICNALDRALSRKSKRLIITTSPRHGKSELVSRLFPSYAFGRDPSLNVMTASYGDKLAKINNRAVQRYIGSADYSDVFPETKLPSGKADENGVVAIKTQNAFEIENHPGIYLSSGVSGSQTGMGFHVGIIDDPFKNREEAESLTIRDSVWDWYLSTFYTRQIGSDASIIIIVTRWHEDDLVGRLLEQQELNPDADQWELINLPGIIEEVDLRFQHPDDHRKLGDALWPSRYDEAFMLRTKASLGEYEFASLYQQRPTPAGGSRIKKEWLKTIDESECPQGLSWVRGYDLAVSAKKTADETAGIQLAIDWDENVYVRLGYHEKKEWPDIHEIMANTSKLEGIPIGIEKAGQQGGFIDELLRDNDFRGVQIEPVPVDGDKLTRANPWISKARNKKFFIVKSEHGDNSWISKYVADLTKFTGINDKYDHYVDATSVAYHMASINVAPDIAEVLKQFHMNRDLPVPIKLNYDGAFEVYQRPEPGTSYYMVIGYSERETVISVFNWKPDQHGISHQVAEFSAIDFGRAAFVEAIKRIALFYTADNKSTVTMLINLEEYGELLVQSLENEFENQMVYLFPTYEANGHFKREQFGKGWKLSKQQKEMCFNYLKAAIVKQRIKPHGIKSYEIFSRYFREEGKIDYTQLLIAWGLFAYCIMQEIKPIAKDNSNVDAFI